MNVAVGELLSPTIIRGAMPPVDCVKNTGTVSVLIQTKHCGHYLLPGESISVTSDADGSFISSERDAAQIESMLAQTQAVIF